MVHTAQSYDEIREILDHDVIEAISGKSAAALAWATERRDRFVLDGMIPEDFTEADQDLRGAF